ncbi:hypothetical protein BSLG_010430 [Batrachochytrium salamandrivorans]|nr:hypothetical protein BSLG_010430 [Batrachochytrium salamandrivorans]
MLRFIKNGLRVARKSPIAMGAPFMGMIVAASYGFSYLTQVKYDYIDAKYRAYAQFGHRSNSTCSAFDGYEGGAFYNSSLALDEREALGLERTSEPVDIRKVYFDLANDDNDWDFVRVPRGPDER